MTFTPRAAAQAWPTPARDSHDSESPPESAAVRRLRPRSGVLEGFVPVELADATPRALLPTDPAPAPPPAVIEAIESWTDRETLFGDLEARDVGIFPAISCFRSSRSKCPERYTRDTWLPARKKRMNRGGH